MKRGNGYWTWKRHVLICSECGHIIGNATIPKYCSNCGSKMVEVKMPEKKKEKDE